MLTVIVGRDSSGYRSTRALLARRYSVTPSTLATFRGASAARSTGTHNNKTNRAAALWQPRKPMAKETLKPHALEILARAPSSISENPRRIPLVIIAARDVIAEIAMGAGH